MSVNALPKVGFAAEIEMYAKTHGPLTIGVAGAGQMSCDLVVNLSLMSGVRLGVICARAEQARDAALMGGGEETFTFAANASAIDRAIESGKIALTEDYKEMCASGLVDVIVDATGNPNVGALVALETVKNGKHIVMLNVEADITIGRYLKEEARKAGVVYTGAAGDEPQAIIELISFAQSIGLEVIAAGKGKNNALKWDATPDQYEQEARDRNMNARMLVEFVDGSKTNVEMTAVANATGLTPDVPGMHGPAATYEEIAQVLCDKDDGGILSKRGCVDYTIGKGVAPGVFCIVRPRHARQIERMSDLKVGPGPCFALVRPFHLTSIEVPLSAIRAVKYRRPDIEPLERPVGECAALAKRDIAVGETLGRIGTYDYRGHAMSWRDAREKGALPMGLAERAKVIKPIKKGEKLTYENCIPDDSLLVTQIRRRLDQSDAQFMD
jgi:predicted homoserine dehydrogenase-like protein